MELNLCASCGAFVNKTWDACTACGAKIDALQPALAPISPAPEVAEVAGRQKDEVTPERVEETVGQVPELPGFDHMPAMADAPEPVSAPDPAPPASAPPVIAVGDSPEHFAIQWSTSNAPAEPVEPIDWSHDPPPTSAAAAAVAAAAAEATRGSSALPNQDAVPPAKSFTLPSYLRTPGIKAAGVTTLSDKNNPFGKLQWAGKVSKRKLDGISKDRLLALVSGGATVVIAVIGVVVVLFGSSTKDKSTTTSSEKSQGAGNAAVSAVPEWVDFNDPQGRFSVKLPSSPESQTAGTKTILLSKSSIPDEVATVSREPVPQNVRSQSNKQILQLAASDLAASTGLSLKGQTFGNNGAEQFLDAFLANETKSINVRFLVRDNTLYQLRISTDDTTNDAEAFSKLTSSFAYKP